MNQFTDLHLAKMSCNYNLQPATSLNKDAAPGWMSVALYMLRLLTDNALSSTIPWRQELKNESSKYPTPSPTE